MPVSQLNSLSAVYMHVACSQLSCQKMVERCRCAHESGCNNQLGTQELSLMWPLHNNTPVPRHNTKERFVQTHVIKHKTLGMSMFHRRHSWGSRVWGKISKLQALCLYLSIILLTFPYQSKLYNAFHTTGKIMTIKTLQIYNNYCIMFYRC